MIMIHQTTTKHYKDVHGGRKFKCNRFDFVCLIHAGPYLHYSLLHLVTRFKCDKCNYEGTQEVNLKHHIESKHGNIVYSCKLCSIQKKVSWYFENHLKRKHGICDKNEFHKYTEKSECKIIFSVMTNSDGYTDIELEENQHVKPVEENHLKRKHGIFFIKNEFHKYTEKRECKIKCPVMSNSNGYTDIKLEENQHVEPVEENTLCG